MHPNTVVEQQPTQLPHPIVIEGTVVHGEKVGRTIGFPTANVSVTTSSLEQLQPGVYFGSCAVAHNPQLYDCLPYYGPRFIFGEKHNVFEVFIYDFNKEIYGQTLTIQLTHSLRNPIQITSLEHLELQLNQDKKIGTTLRRNQITI
jgi:riboflavin kinase/FMN adenylyltransferase